MTELSPRIDDVVSQALQSAEAGRSVYIEGPVGAGRNQVVEKLCDEGEDRMASVDLLPLSEADASGVALFEALSHLRGAESEWLTFRTGSSAELHNFARRTGEQLHQTKKILVLRIPDSWQTAEHPSRKADVLPLRARSVLDGFFKSPVTTIVVADAAITPSWLGYYPETRFQLQPHFIDVGALKASGWGSYLSAVERLEKGAGSLKASPFACRLAVGAIALDAPTESVAAELARPVAISRIAQALAQRICMNPAVTRAVARFLAVRRPIERSAVPTLTGVPDEHAPLLTDCIGYGDRVTRVSTVVRSFLMAAMRELGEATPEDHSGLVQHYSAADGAASPIGLGPAALRAWCEKAHHLALSNRADEDGAWERLELPAPSFFWDRARYLSIEKRDYTGAAAIYKKCVERFPEDDYAWHYFAFNLERAQGDREAVRRGYGKAIDLNPDNPWWNSRLVTYLIRSGSPGAAKDEWRRAIDRVDPDGTQARSSDWLAHNFHFWVCRAWLAVGQYQAAKDVLEMLPHSYLKRGPLSHLLKRSETTPKAWQRFLNSLTQYHGVNEELARHIREWWSVLTDGRELPLPMADMTADGERFQLAWNYESLFMEIEVLPDGSCAWFAKDKRTADVADGVVALGASLPRDLIAWLVKLPDA